MCVSYCKILFRLLVNCSSLFPFLEIKSGTESNITVNEVQRHKNSIQESSQVVPIIKQKRSAGDENVAKGNFSNYVSVFY